MCQKLRKMSPTLLESMVLDPSGGDEAEKTYGGAMAGTFTVVVSDRLKEEEGHHERRASEGTAVN